MIAKTPEKMPDEMPEPARWSDSPSESGTAEQTIGVAFRRVREATEPSDTAVASVARRLNTEPESSRGRMLWRLAIAAALIMATGGAVGAALHRWRRADAVVPAPATPAASARSAAALPHHRRRHPAAGVADLAESTEVEQSPELPPAESPVPVVPALEPPAPVPAVVAPAPVASAPSVAPIAVEAHRPSRERHAAAAASESVGAAIIADAFRDLRSRGDAEAALLSLDEYDRRFPGGVLRAESRVARVEALLMLERRAEALQLLEAAGQGGALTRDVRVTRGELLVESNRCADAVRDFDAVLAARDGDSAGGRALYGRASCRSRGGDSPGARADLTRYLSLHADGPSAAAARRALAALP
jgi:hypothetical protein